MAGYIDAWRDGWGIMFKAKKKKIARRQMSDGVEKITSVGQATIWDFPDRELMKKYLLLWTTCNARIESVACDWIALFKPGWDFYSLKEIVYVAGAGQGRKSSFGKPATNPKIEVVQVVIRHGHQVLDESHEVISIPTMAFLSEEGFWKAVEWKKRGGYKEEGSMANPITSNPRWLAMQSDN